MDKKLENHIDEMFGPTFEQWVKFGFDRGWVGPPVCETHDGVPLSAEENAEFEQGDPCVHILRLYEDVEHKAAVELEHSPSVWRASNQGWGK